MQKDRRTYQVFSKLMLGGSVAVVLFGFAALAPLVTGEPLTGPVKIAVMAGLAAGWLAAVIGSIRLMDVMPRLVDTANHPQRLTEAQIKGVYVRTSLGVTILAAAAVAIAW